MIEAEYFYKQLLDFGVDFFTGVPDSLLKSFCAYITDNADENKHIIAVNEGAAVALAAGYYFASGAYPLVYMQNSGIGNAVNPLLSLADPDVYRIPMLLVIGWRGEPGVYDEPQHVKQGKTTCGLLEAMGISYAVLEKTEDGVCRQINTCFHTLAKTYAPYAFVVQKDTFAPYMLQNKSPDPAGAEMTREEAIEKIILAEGSKDRGIFISTTGMISRELYELREKYRAGHERDFLTVGSMGHASSIALSIALQKPELSVFCLDGDGAVLMHMGALASIGVKKPRNLCHIVLNNGAHDSVGGQPTIAPFIDIPEIARACGYAHVYAARTLEELQTALAAANAEKEDGATFIEVRVKKGARKDLGRPKSTPAENKDDLMKYMNGK
ncbi:MAG: phosphonopyruvate decarboxylase [Spirochaetaceae bacterium]|jgi:phosphonopyruvate decarboxylase|nr:phosphonopyruvate decarboxylase [Spirochaetaceae bacterium]